MKKTTLAIMLLTILVVSCLVLTACHSCNFGEWAVIEQATCTEAGLKVQVCECGESRTEIIPATNHSYAPVVTAPTCTEQGFTTHTCVCGDSYVDTYVDALGHTEGSVVVENNIEPNCTEDGSYDNVVYCTVCEAELSRETKTIEAGHSYSAVVTPPTCTKQGFTTHTCACGDSYVDTYVDAPGHTEGEVVVENRVDATCTIASSYDNVIYCIVCEIELSRESKVVDVLGHDKIGHIAQAPTCTEIGWDAYVTCSRCDYSTYNEIPATGHSYTSVVTPPTCTEQGYTTHTCACGDSYIDTYIDASHSYTAVVTEPTCTEQGFTTHNCGCGESYVDAYVGANGHNYDNGACTVCGNSAPIWSTGLVYALSDDKNSYEVSGIGTCNDSDIIIPSTYDGKPVTGICENAFNNCGSNLKSITIPNTITHIGNSAFANCIGLTGVTFEEGSRLTRISNSLFFSCSNLVSIKIPSSVVSIGTNAFYWCNSLTAISFEGSKCWYVTKTEGATSGTGISLNNASQNATYLRKTYDDYYWYVHSTGHNYDTVLTSPTCTERGYITYTCNNCGDSYVDTYVDALGHDEIEHVAQAPTCTEIGWDAYVTCSRCDYSTYNEIPATGHSYEAEVTEPTCTEQGFTTHTCACGDSYVDTYVDATGHTEGSVVVENKVDATCTEDGSYDDVVCCTVCGAELSRESKIVDALEHDEIEHAAQEPTCTEFGWDAYVTCSRCDYSTYNEIPAQHTYVNLVCSACGDVYYSKGLEYRLSDDGTTYIVSGIGTCTDTDIVIPSIYNELSVTSIGSQAFWICTSLESITIPNSVTSIDYYAFNRCTSLKSVVLDTESQLMSIGEGAFNCCTDLKSITIPSNVTSIGIDAFFECTSLTKVEITDLASWCKLDFPSYYTPSLSSNPLYNNPLYYAGHLYFNGEEIIELVIPDTITEIKEFTFVGSKITSVSIPSSVTSIGAYAFYNCTSLTNITIPASVKSIDAYAFSGTGLTSVQFEATYGWYVKPSADDVGGIFLSNINYSQDLNAEYLRKTYDDYYWYYACKGHSYYGQLTEPTCTEQGYITYICTYCKDSYVGTYVDIDATAHNYVDGICTYCGDRVSVGLEYTLSGDGNSYIVSGIGTCTDTDVVIPSTYEGKPVTSISDYAFNDCTSLTSVTIGDGVTTIDFFAFFRCLALEEVTLPNTLEHIGVSAFCGCTGLKKVNFNGGRSEWELLIANAEANNQALATATITLANGEQAEYVDAKYLEYTLNESNATYTITGIGLFNGSTLIIPDTYEGKPVTSIGDFAFSECNNIVEVTIGNNITTIGMFAFDSCGQLETVTIPENVETVGENAFYMCENLVTVDIATNSKITIISKSMFHWCKKLSSISIPNGVTSIEYMAFYGCESLTSITIPSKVTYIGDSAFSNNKSLKSITIPVSVKTIDRAAFCTCTSLTTFNYAGTKTQWNSISKGNQWADYSAFDEVVCSNGTISI